MPTATTINKEGFWTFKNLRYLHKIGLYPNEYRPNNRLTSS
jgi:hypothetical protein